MIHEYIGIVCINHARPQIIFVEYPQNLCRQNMNSMYIYVCYIKLKINKPIFVVKFIYSVGNRIHRICSLGIG